MFVRTIGLVLTGLAAVVAQPERPSLRSNRPLLILLAARDFDYQEYRTVRDGLQRHQLGAVCVSTDSGVARAANDSLVRPDIALAAVDPGQFAGLAVVGGIGAARLWDDSLVLARVRSFAQDSAQVIGAIGTGPIVLAKVGVLTGRRATVIGDPRAVRLLTGLGVRLVRAEVVTDGRFVTANTAAAGARFVDALVARLNRGDRQ